jgi:rubrerythrin
MSADLTVPPPMLVIPRWHERLRHLDRPTDFAERGAAIDEAADLRKALAARDAIWQERIASLSARLEAAERDAARWRTHLESADGGNTHECRRCGYGYRPAGADEDCPRCGYDGRDAASQEGKG